MTTKGDYTGFELSVSLLRNAIYFSINPMPEKSHFSYKTWKNTCEFHLYCCHHVYKVNKWCFHHEGRVSTQIMVCEYFITKCKKFLACNRHLMGLWNFFFLSPWSKIITLRN